MSVSALKRDRAAKKLRKALALADDDACLEMLWALAVTNDGPHSGAAKLIKFPAEYFDEERMPTGRALPWEIETLATERLLIPPLRIIEGERNRIIDCRSYNAARLIVNALRDLENEEAGCYLEQLDILIEMHRIAHRQFPAQAGFFNRLQFYRYGYIYGGPKCQHHFERKTGLTMNTLAFVAFGLTAHFQRQPTHPRKFSMPFPSVSDADTARALSMLALPIDQARAQQRSMIATLTSKWGYKPPTAFRPSVLRQFPVLVGTDGLMRCPLPEYATLRVTAGLYYDLVDAAAGDLRNEASDRFEQYCLDFTDKMLPQMKPRREIKYTVSGREFLTPDVLCSDAAGIITLAIECKASKLTFDAQFAADPIKEAGRGYDELAKGIFQVWRFFAHARNGQTPMRVAPDAHGLIVTLDAWLNMDTRLKADVLRRANELADRDGNIKTVDRRPVMIAHVNEYEAALLGGDEAALFDALKHAATESFSGWSLTSVQRERRGEKAESKRYPFDPARVFPFFDTIDDVAETLGKGRPSASGRVGLAKT